MRKRFRFAARRDLRLPAVILVVILGWVCWVEYKASQLSEGDPAGEKAVPVILARMRDLSEEDRP